MQEETTQKLAVVDGKVHHEIEKIEQQERVLGINHISPFRTNDRTVLRHKLKGMTLNRLVTMAKRTGAKIAADEEQLRKNIEEAFNSYIASQQKVVASSETKNIAGFDNGPNNVKNPFGTETEEELVEKLRMMTLSDTQTFATKLGFRAIFDQKRMANAIKEAFRRFKNSGKV